MSATAPKKTVKEKKNELLPVSVQLLKIAARHCYNHHKSKGKSQKTMCAVKVPVC